MQRLSPLDASFLHLERDVQQLNVGSALVFEGPAPTHAEVCRAIEALLSQFPRYRQHVRSVPLGLALPIWVDDPQFRLHDHVGHRRLRPPGTDDALRRLAVRLISHPLDLRRPLWHTWLVTGLRDGRFALVNTNHHAMIDGISGSDIISVLLSPDPTPGPPEHTREPPPPPWLAASEPTEARLALDAVVELASSPLRAVNRSARALRPQALPTSVAEVVGMARLGEQLAHLDSGSTARSAPVVTGGGCGPTSRRSRP